MRAQALFENTGVLVKLIVSIQSTTKNYALHYNIELVSCDDDYFYVSFGLFSYTVIFYSILGGILYVDAISHF